MPESAAEPADIETPARTFPTDDALCEHCGYPLKGLSSDAACPECGLAVAESSPAKRDLDTNASQRDLASFLIFMVLFLLRPRTTFRRLSVKGPNLSAQSFLFYTTFITGMLLASGWLLVNSLNNRLGSTRHAMTGFLIVFIGSAIAINLLTHIEMLGVTAFSRRRGWRVPFRLAERVCCFASVGWLPGAAVVGLGYGLLHAHAFGQPWFEQLLGLVRVSWLCFAGLFLLALLWFETLVWIGVRQVKYANAWHRADDRTDPSTDPPPGAG